MADVAESFICRVVHDGNEQVSRKECRKLLVSDAPFWETMCSIPDDHIDPRRSAFFLARSVLRDIREGVLC